MDRPSISLNSIKSERSVLSACVLRGQAGEGPVHPQALLIIIRRLPMTYYIGIDVSKKVLNVFDGKKDLIFDNKENLSSFKKYLKKRYPDLSSLVILFEATGIYSYHLKAFCAAYHVKAYVINPQASHSFAKSLEHLPRPIPVMPEPSGPTISSLVIRISVSLR